MELKWYNAFAASSKTKSFQSYLYGIEIMNTCLQRGDYFQVSIVPLWNWNVMHLWWIPLPVWFQSYLYGIEIWLKRQRMNCLNRFNRTFMELKYRNGRVIIDSRWFQSYLYGIEIFGNFYSSTKYPTFQSYLYGIEIAQNKG